MPTCCATRAHVPRGQAELVAAFVRAMFAQPAADAARRQLRGVATRLERTLLKAATVISDAEYDVTAYAVLSRIYARKIVSTKALEWVNNGIKWRNK